MRMVIIGVYDAVGCEMLINTAALECGKSKEMPSLTLGKSLYFDFQFVGSDLRHGPFLYLSVYSWGSNKRSYTGVKYVYVKISDKTTSIGRNGHNIFSIFLKDRLISLFLSCILHCEWTMIEATMYVNTPGHIKITLHTVY
jgi:hypothetical protein